MQTSSDYLIHYGTKGQKHGVRRYQNPDGSLTPEGRERYGVGQAKVRKKSDVGTKLKSAVKNVGEKAGYQVRKKTNRLSDQELKKEVDRMKMEREYKNLNQELHGKRKNNNNQPGFVAKSAKGFMRDLGKVFKVPLIAALAGGMGVIYKKKVNSWLASHKFI